MMVEEADPQNVCLEVQEETSFDLDDDAIIQTTIDGRGKRFFVECRSYVVDKVMLRTRTHAIAVALINCNQATI